MAIPLGIVVGAVLMADPAGADAEAAADTTATNSSTPRISTLSLRVKVGLGAVMDFNASSAADCPTRGSNLDKA